MVSCAPCTKMMPRNIPVTYEDDIIARRYLPPALARSTPFNRAISCELKSPLKVPKRENFSLAFFALNEPIWVCDFGTGGKNRIFYQLTPDFDVFLVFFRILGVR